jgi:hypothetical protein
MYRFARVGRQVALILFVSATIAAQAFAQGASLAPPAQGILAEAIDETGTPGWQVAMPPGPQPPQVFTTERGARRPRALIPLYVSFASLQGLDAHSTTRALNRGAAEANPLMRGLADHPAGLLAVKAAATTGVVLAGEKMWKRNRVAAVVFMVAANSAMAWVVQHNYRAVR